MEKEGSTFYQKLFVIIMFVMIGLWLIFFIAGDMNQLNVFFRQGAGFLGDFVFKCTTSRDPYDWVSGETAYAGVFCYPPLAYLMLYPFSKIVQNNTPVLMAVILYDFFLLAGLLAVLDNVKAKNRLFRYLIPVLLFSSSITLASLDRGNIIIVSAMLALVFLFYYDSDDKVLRELSYLALAVSAGLKLYPAVFGLLLLKNKRYKDAVRLMIYGLLAFFLPFLFFKGGFGCIPLFFRNLHEYSEVFRYVDHPAFNFKFFANGISDVFVRDTIYSIFGIIDKVLAVAGIAAAYLAKEKWKEISVISLCIIWFSVHSGLYMGLFFYAGMVLFLNDAKKTVFNTLCFVCIIMILNPFQLILPGGYDLTYALINIGASALACLLIFDVFRDQLNRYIKKESVKED